MIKVVVPATSANLGPGFDTLGMALNLYNTFIFEEIPNGIEILGCDTSYRNEDNLVYTSFLKTLNRIGYSYNKGIKITIKDNIPISRGLGSSAACIVGGIMGANKLARSPLSIDEIIEIATEIEGHPDNVTPAILGGAVVSIIEGNKVIYNKLDVAQGLKYIALIPEFGLSTSKARSVLPESIPYKDAVYNVSRVSLLITSLANGSFDLLKYALNDKLHQPYRGMLIPDFHKIMEQCNALGSYGTFLSGAGPTIMALVDEKNNDLKKEIGKFLDTLENKWDVVELCMDLKGAKVLDKM